MSEGRLKSEDITSPLNRVRRMAMPQLMRVDVETCDSSPHRHASGHRLKGQWAIPFIAWKKPVTRLAAAQRLEQRQRVGADADGAGFAALTQQPNVAAFIQRLNVLPPQTAQLRYTAPEQIRPTDHDVVPRCDGCPFYLGGTDNPKN